MASIEKPKVFISYNWTSDEHQEKMRDYATRLQADGVDVLFDLWELQMGHDKYAYMERMVSDPDVTHVLLFCDANTPKRLTSVERELVLRR